MSTETAAAKRTLLALDIGGTKVGWALVEVAEPPIVVESGAIQTRAMEGGEAVASRIRELVVEILQTRGGVEGVAVASAGVVDPASGDIVSATNTMPGWGGVRLGDILREATGLPVEALNDVHAHGLGEAVLGAGRDHRTVLSMAVGTGIGGAIVEDGEVFFGSHDLAGHIGHIHHSFAPDMQCSCGRKGHIESFCSGSGITAWYRARRTASDPEANNGRELQDLADAGEELALDCFARSAYAVGECLGSLANSVDPSIIVLSGSMTRSGRIWWDALAEGYAASAMNAVAGLDLVKGSLGGDAPLLGAVLHYLTRHAES